MNITAKNIEEFRQIEEKLQELPSRVYDQIVSAKKGISGIDCSIDKFNSTDLYLPKKIVKICDYVDELVIITNDFVFRIKKSPDTAYIMCFID